MAPRTLAGRYELAERLGSGGMATVWRARDTSLGRDVAVKILHPALADAASHDERFRREARNAAGLSHPNIVTVYDTGTDDDGEAFIVMELVEGRTLHEVLRTQGPLGPAAAVGVGRGVLSALAHAHSRGLVHRDVKPGNVMITPDGDVKVTDFGIAKGLEEATQLTQTGTLMGTASYLSPEQAEGGRATQASDLYSLGCVLYECLAGRPPFQGDTPVAVALQHRQNPVPPLTASRRDVPRRLADVVHKALEKDPARRFSSAAQMDAALAATGLTPDDAATTVAIAAGDAPTMAYAAGDEAATRRMGPAAAGGRTEALPRTPPPPSTARRAFTFVVVLLLVALAALIAAFALTDGDDPEVTPTPPPTLAPTQDPGAVATAEPAPSPTPTPEPTPEVTPTPTPTLDIRTPRPPRTPDLGGGGGGATPTPSPTPTPTPVLSP